jgi:hypothetical protein
MLKVILIYNQSKFVLKLTGNEVQIAVHIDIAGTRKLDGV